MKRVFAEVAVLRRPLGATGACCRGPGPGAWRHSPQATCAPCWGLQQGCGGGAASARWIWALPRQARHSSYTPARRLPARGNPGFPRWPSTTRWRVATAWIPHPNQGAPISSTRGMSIPPGGRRSVVNLDDPGASAVVQQVASLATAGWARTRPYLCHHGHLPISSAGPRRWIPPPPSAQPAAPGGGVWHQVLPSSAGQVLARGWISPPGELLDLLRDLLRRLSRRHRAGTPGSILRQ